MLCLLAACPSFSGTCTPEQEGKLAQVRVHVLGQRSTSHAWLADGTSLVPVQVDVLDGCAQPVPGRVPVEVHLDGLEWLPENASNAANAASVSELSAAAAGSVAMSAQDGQLRFSLRAPVQPRQAVLQVNAAGVTAQGTLRFGPDIRPLVAAGVVEGTLFLHRSVDQSVVPSTGLNDGFEQALRSFQRQFDGGQMALAGRTSFFVKGAIRGDTLLTASFDSDKPVAAHTLADISPDRYYPVMGDSAQRGIETKSSDRLFVRLDNGRNYLLYGDFATGEGFSQSVGGPRQVAGSIVPPVGLPLRQLGAYTRAMTGIHAHREDTDGYVDAFLMRDSLRQAVEEYRGNGTSGPYAVGNLNAVENSETIQVVTRDRNNASRILSMVALVRYQDYTFEPFSGRILLKAPLSALDSDLNPVSLRITYEVDTQGAAFWVGGVAAQRRIHAWLELGGAVIKDNNSAAPLGGTGYATAVGRATQVPMELRELVSANAGIHTGSVGVLALEVAQARSATATDDIIGLAGRFDWQGKGVLLPLQPGEPPRAWEGRVWGGSSSQDFNNPAAPYSNGKVEAGAHGMVAATSTTKVIVDAIHSEDRVAETSRNGDSLQLEHALGEGWTVDAGVRHIQQSAGAALSLSANPAALSLPGQASAFGGSGLNPSGAGFWGQGGSVNPVSGQEQVVQNGQVVSAGLASPAVDATTIKLGARYVLRPGLQVGGEVGRDYGLDTGSGWVALLADYRQEALHAAARLEVPTQRAMVAADYQLTASTSVYGRLESGNALAPGYALDTSAQSQAAVFGAKQSLSHDTEEYSEYRLQDGMNGREVENANGLRHTFDLAEDLKANALAERLRVMSGGGRGASALGGGLEWMHDAWHASARLEWRTLDATPGGLTDDRATSWLDTLSLARKLDASWTALVRNYFLLTDNQGIPGNQLQNRFQVGGAYRPVERNDFDALLRYENKFQRNQEMQPQERSLAHILSINLNEHPASGWWDMERLAVKHVSEDLTGVQSDYLAWLASGRVMRDLSDQIDVGVMASVMGSPQGATRQFAYGIEGGYRVVRNLWASLGYNLSGFSDRDLTGSDYTQRGLYVRLRMKFDEYGLEAVASAVKARFGEDDKQ